MNHIAIRDRLIMQFLLLVTVRKMAKIIGWSKTPGVNIGVTMGTSKWLGTEVTIVALLLMECILLFEFNSFFV